MSEGGEIVSIDSGWRQWRTVGPIVAAVAGLSILVAACGDDDGDDGGGAGGDGGTLACGLGNGEQASGQPIKFGAINTKQPGTDFSEGGRAVQAYFECVNDNGGINGRPVELLIETEQTDPGQIANAATKLAESDKVVGFAGNFSIIEGSVNHTFYEQNGFNVLCAGIAPEAYSTPNMACVNMGPRYSSDGAVQAVIRQDVDKVVFDQSNVPGTEYIVAGPRAVAEDEGVEFQAEADTPPIQDANSVALKLVQAAGPNGGVVLNFTPPEALKILQAAQQQGLADQVKAWGCSTPCNTDFVAEALDQSFDDKLLVNAELNVTDADDEDSQLYRDVMAEYANDLPLGSFTQMGFVIGQIATEAMLNIDGDVTKESYNKAVKEIKNFRTGILCAPWYFGDAPLHIPNNIDWTTTPQGGKMVIKEDCFEISDADPDIAQVRQIEEQDPSLIGE
jgi:branched-chain amino acid transport system substrate-binding protein